MGLRISKRSEGLEDLNAFDTLGPEREKNLIDNALAITNLILMSYNSLTPEELLRIGTAIKKAVTSIVTEFMANQVNPFADELDLDDLLGKHLKQSMFLTRLVTEVVNNVRGV